MNTKKYFIGLMAFAAFAAVSYFAVDSFAGDNAEELAIKKKDICENPRKPGGCSGTVTSEG